MVVPEHHRLAIEGLGRQPYQEICREGDQVDVEDRVVQTQVEQTSLSASVIDRRSRRGRERVLLTEFEFALRRKMRRLRALEVQDNVRRELGCRAESSTATAFLNAGKRTVRIC